MIKPSQSEKKKIQWALLVGRSVGWDGKQSLGSVSDSSLYQSVLAGYVDFHCNYLPYLWCLFIECTLF
jgi:hypothetical protein